MSWTLTVTDLKQYVYCPRVFYFSRCLPKVRPVTGKMVEGIAAGEEAEAREARRQLRTYGFERGERHFALDLQSSILRVAASIDLVILRPDGREEAIPVDYKLSDTVGPHFKMQLACYGLLIEEEMDLPAPYGFVYLIPLRRAEKVVLSARLKAQARAALADMFALVETEAMPAPTTHRGRCVNCEFRRFCNDVL